MKGIALLALASVALALGTFFRMLRWKSFIEVYEDPANASLLRALVTGYAINFFLPLRIGDLVRAWQAGRRFKNGFSFSLATTLLDYFLDIPVVCVIFIFFAITRGGNTEAVWASLWWFFCFLVVLSALYLSGNFSAAIKKSIRLVCSIFNEPIQIILLFFYFSCVAALKDCFYELSKLRTVLLSIALWSSYGLSYILLDKFISINTTKECDFNVFVLFMSNNIFKSTYTNISKGILPISLSIFLSVIVYFFVALLFVLIISIIYKKDGHGRPLLHSNRRENKPILYLLPQVRKEDRLDFLERYFSGEGREQIIRYLLLNRDVIIVNDLSKGSNATTLLCMQNDKIFYRKYAFERDKDKLREQVCWIHQHENKLSLPLIISEKHEQSFSLYDMKYMTQGQNFFSFIHSHPVDESWGILQKILQDLADKLWISPRTVDHMAIEKYVRDKVMANLERVERSPVLQELFAHNIIKINGRPCWNLPSLRHLLSHERLSHIFSKDPCTQIHGDLTVENIIACKDIDAGYYLIDPNQGNILDSPFLDYAKLLQSLHGGYEFLMNTNTVTVEDNKVCFPVSYSQNYAELYARYAALLRKQFLPETLKSIYYHEIIHWLRLLPYKLQKIPQQASWFLAGFLLVLNDVAEEFKDDDA